MPMVFDETRGYNVPGKVLYRESLNVINDLRLELKRADEENGIIEARKGASMWTWGEHIRIMIHSLPAGSSVFVESAVRYQMIDYGRNRKNVLQIFEELNRRVAALGPITPEIQNPPLATPASRRCTSCGTLVPPESVFCLKCGTKLNHAPKRDLGVQSDHLCRLCNAPISKDALFCGGCGGKVDSPPKED